MSGDTRRPTGGGIQEDGGAALRLTVLVGESEMHRSRPLYTEIVHRAHGAGLSGASVFRGIEGFGAGSLIHTARLLSLGENLPVAVVAVDTAQRIRAFLPLLDDLDGIGLVLLDACEVVPRPQKPDLPHTHGTGSGR